jgi:hypothetical protein
MQLCGVVLQRSGPDAPKLTGKEVDEILANTFTSPRMIGEFPETGITTGGEFSRRSTKSAMTVADDGIVCAARTGSGRCCRDLARHCSLRRRTGERGIKFIKRLAKELETENGREPIVRERKAVSRRKKSVSRK